jgi:hypothetical protein
MRILVFLVVALPLVLGSPFFWSLTRMAWGAEPVGYVQADGTVQNATIGPKSFWPDWAIRPQGAAMTVDSYFMAAPGMPAIGLASLDFKDSQLSVASRYETDLLSQGFEVTRYAGEFWSPDLPPRQFVHCVIEGADQATPRHTIRLSFSVASNAMPAKLSWTEGEIVPLAGMQPGNCF